jgi:hypothetical protein
MSDQTDFRKEKDDFFAHDLQSPLIPEQKRSFHGLVYFPENPSLRMEVTVQRFPKPEKVQMQTSTGDVQTYTRFSRFKFSGEGEEAELTLYKDRSSYFLPSSTRWLARKPMSQGISWSRNCWVMINSWSISTWPIILAAPITTTGTVLSLPQKIG